MRLFSWLCVALLALASLSSAVAVTVTPVMQDLENATDEVYQFVFAITNDDAKPRSLTLRLQPYSAYLEQRVVFSKEQFALLPGATENVQLRISPQGLGPQTHTLGVDVVEDEEMLTSFALRVTVPGTPQEEYALAVDARDTNTAAAVPVTVTLTNHGNVIGYAQVELVVRTDKDLVGTLTYPDRVQLLPGASEVYDLVYTEQLQPGFYNAEITASIGGVTYQERDSFTVRLEQATERLELGSDLILTFASLGNPAAVSYRLEDKKGETRLSGSAVPGADIIVPTSTLPAGVYELYVLASGSEQVLTVLIEAEREPWKWLVVLVAIGLLMFAAYSFLPAVRIHLRISKLRRTLQRQEADLTKLINRAHKLVDSYHSTHARRQQTVGSARAPGQGLG